MAWNLFRSRKKHYEVDDELQIVINRIEKFAPKVYLEHREMHYYNYGQYTKYRDNLFSLLGYVSETSREKENREVFIQELFRLLKDFYDTSNKLSMREAIEDNGLKVKCLKLVRMFYDDTALTQSELNGYLERMVK